jgi:hypothetical protein
MHGERLRMHVPGELELQIMRNSISALVAERPHCHDCRRTPLTGERVFLYGDEPVCELCRPLRRDEPTRTVPVRGWEHGTAVRPTVRASRNAA